MIDKKLVKYLKEGLDKGYSLESLKSLLLKKGFSEKDIDDAIKALSKRRNLNLKPVLYVAIALAVLIILFFFIKSLLQKQPVLDPMQKLPVYRQWVFENYLTKPEFQNEITTCKAIIDEKPEDCNDKYDCLAEYYFVKAHQYNNPSLCNNIIKPYELLNKEICIASVTKKQTKCDTITDQTIKQVCNLFVTGDKNNCANLQSELGIDCSDYIIMLKEAFPSSDASLCSQISVSTTKEECDALVSKNSSLCTDERATYIAYAIMATEFKNSSFCDMIKFSDVKESCINRLNCEFITDKSEKQDCMKEFL